jgi:membrane-associated phospholipid phosphatase
MKRSVLISLLLTLVCLSLFGVIAAAVVAEGALTHFDFQHTARLYHFASSSDAVWRFFLGVTDLGAGNPLKRFSYALVILVLAHMQFRLALLCAAVMLLNHHSIDLLKDFFARARPPSAPLGMNPSFPSGHAQGSMVVYGLAIYLAFLRWPDSWFRWVAAIGLGALIVLIGLSRLMLGVHFFSDVLAGDLMGIAWLGLVVAAVGWQRPPSGPAPIRPTTVVEALRG